MPEIVSVIFKLLSTPNFFIVSITIKKKQTTKQFKNEIVNQLET